MDTALQWTRNDGKTSRWFAGSLLLHASIAGVSLFFAFFHHSSDPWGEKAETSGAIQASMVNALPLPQRTDFKENAVLASDEPSPSPIQTKTATVEQPKPDAIPIPVKEAKPVKVAEKTAPAVLHPQPVTPQPTKAVTGETSGTQIPMAVEQLAHGTASAAVQDRAFGNRYAYYGKLIEQAVAKNWYTGLIDAHSSNGKRVTLTFEVTRDGTPTNAHVTTSSGSSSLDSSALQAIQRTEGFGPLPAGDHLTVEYSFDYHQ